MNPQWDVCSRFAVAVQLEAAIPGRDDLLDACGMSD